MNYKSYSNYTNIFMNLSVKLEKKYTVRKKASRTF